MDDDTLNLLKTVCAAGRARAGYDGNSNDRLEKLVHEGLLKIVTAPGPVSKAPRRSYQPTDQGRAMLRQLSEKGAA